jgi:hypothetical protein
LTPETFQLLEIAASVLSACKSRHVPVALVVPLTEHDSIVQCLRDANIAQLFAAVVRFSSSDMAFKNRCDFHQGVFDTRQAGRQAVLGQHDALLTVPSTAGSISSAEAAVAGMQHSVCTTVDL